MKLLSTRKIPYRFTLLANLLIQNLCFGFITAVIIKQLLSLGFVVFFNIIEASSLFAFMLGIISSGYGSEYRGRQFWMLVGWLMLSLALLSSSLNTNVWLSWAELIISCFALGLFINISPIYLAECAPKLARGAWVLTGFLAILVGISIFIFLDFNIQLHSTSWHFIATSVSAISLLLSSHLIESPAWLLEQGHVEVAQQRFQLLRAEKAITKEIAVIKSSLRRRSRTWKPIYKKQLKQKMSVSRNLAILRQLTGISIMLFYVPSIFLAHWTSTLTMLWSLIFISLAMGILFAAVYVDVVGRRKLTILSFLAQALVLLGLSFIWQDQALPMAKLETIETLAFILIYFFCFAAGAGPISRLAWIELMPLRSRARYVSLFLMSSFALGIMIWFVDYALISFIGIKLFYLIAALLALTAAIYSWRKMPETRNLYLEEL